MKQAYLAITVEDEESGHNFKIACANFTKPMMAGALMAMNKFAADELGLTEVDSADALLSTLMIKTLLEDSKQ